MESTSPPAQPTVSRSRWWIHLLLISGYILGVGLLGLGRKGTNTSALSHTAGGLLSVCGWELLIFGCIFGVACAASRATRDDLLLRWHGGIKPVLWGALYSVGLRVAVALLGLAVAIAIIATRLMSPESLMHFLTSNRPGVEAVVNVAAMRNDPAYFWLTLTVVSFVVAGLREELWRSAFLAALKALWPRRFGSRGGQVLAVSICAIVFGLGHLAMGWLAVCMTGVLGIGLGLIMVFHRSIWPAVLAHGFFDAASMAMLPWALSHGMILPS